MSASDLVSPHAPPSGVSIGQMSPHAVGCSCRGFGFLVSLATGVDSFRSCARVVMEVMRVSCCATPFCVVPPRDMMPQFPVDRP